MIELSVKDKFFNNKMEKLHCLEETRCAKINWNGNFKYPDMMRIGTPPDGSCFFHAVVKAFHIPYQNGYIESDGKLEYINRREYILKLRKELSIILGQPSNSLDHNSPTNYDLLGRGEIKILGKTQKEFSFEKMQENLANSVPVGKEIIEFVSDQIDKDIYILSANEEDVYFSGDDESLLYKRRDSIVILSIEDHYETIGVVENDKIVTRFASDHSFIKYIRQRIRSRVR
jgi:hypothetical protein